MALPKTVTFVQNTGSPQDIATYDATFTTMEGGISVQSGTPLYYGTGSQWNTARNNSETFAADQEAEVTITLAMYNGGSAGVYAGPAVRCQSGANTSYHVDCKGDAYYLSKCVAGSQYTLDGPLSITSVAGDKLKLKVETVGGDAVLSVWHADAATPTVFTQVNTDLVDDGTLAGSGAPILTAGYAGIFVYGNSTNIGPGTWMADNVGGGGGGSPVALIESRRLDQLNHPALGPYSQNKKRFKRRYTVAKILNQIDVSVNSDFEAETLSQVESNQTAATASDFETETQSVVANSASVVCSSDFESETASQVAANETAAVSSDFEAETNASASVGTATNTVSDFEAETESFVDVSGGEIGVTVISNFEAESVINVADSVSSISVSDFEAESVAVTTNRADIVTTSDFEAESVISVNVQIVSNSTGEIELETLISVLNEITYQVSSDIEIETLTSVEVVDNSSSVSVVSPIELESAISVISNAIAEILSGFEVESVSVVTVEELSTSLGISNRFDRQIKAAIKLIAKNGQKVIWRVIIDVPDVNKPWESTSQVLESHVVSICFLPANKQALESLVFIPGTEVPKGCVLGYMGATSFEPNLKDVVIRNGVKLSIFYIDKLSPNGQNLLYTLLLKE